VNCITRSVMIYTTRQLLFGWSNQGEKKKMWFLVGKPEEK